MASIRKRTWTTARGEPRTAWLLDFVDRKGERQRKQFDTKREADAFRIEIEGQLRGGTYRPDADRFTVEQAANRYLGHIAGRMTRRERMVRSTHDVLRGHVVNHILHKDHGLGRLRLSQLTARSISAFRDRLRETGVSVAVTRKALGTLALVLDHAISDDLLTFNPARKVRVIGTREEGPKKVVPPSKLVLRELMDAAPEDLRLCIGFAAATGLRASEQWALRWRNVHFEKAEVAVVGRVDLFGTYEALTKSRAGERSVPLGANVIAALKEWRLRSRFSRDEDLVFPNRRGRYRSHTNLMTREFRPLVRGIGAAGDFGWHSLRHYAISTWIEAGLAPKTVQTFAGHSSLQVTMDRYGHLFPSDDHRKAMDAISKGLL